MGTPAQFIEQQSANRQQDSRQQKESMDMLQRQFLAKQYEQYANNIPLPDVKADPEGYKKALDLRTEALNAAQKVYAPEHHATLADHVHGLIFGQRQQPQAQASPVPVSAQAPIVPAPASQGAPPQAPAGQSAPVSDHPFASNPAYAKILEGLNGLGNHLKGAIHPNAPAQPNAPLSDFAAVPTQGDIQRQNVATAAANAQKIEQMRADAQREAAQIRASGSASSTPEKAFLNSWAKKNKGVEYSELDPDDQVSAVTEWKKANASAPKLQFKTIDGNLYSLNPNTGEKKFIAKQGDVTVTTSERPFTNAVTGEVTMIPVTTVRSKKSGQPLASDSGEVPNAPVSNQAPSLDAANSQIAAGNASSKKLNKGKPASNQAPKAPAAPKVVAHTAGLLDKSNAAQYTKVAEDANNKKSSFLSAQKAIQHPTPSSDQELVFSWVRSNVQGAGRMTQAEFKQASQLGSLPQRAQNWYSLSTQGKLTPEMRNMMFADIKRSYDTSQQMAGDLKRQITSPTSSQAPQAPASSVGFDWSSLPGAPQ